MGMPEIQEAPRPSNPWVPMGATVVETGTDALGSLGNRSQGIAFMNGSWMSREVHVQFWERVGVQLPCATHLPLFRQSVILERETGLEISSRMIFDLSPRQKIFDMSLRAFSKIC